MQDLINKNLLGLGLKLSNPYHLTDSMTKDWELEKETKVSVGHFTTISGHFANYVHKHLS